MTSPFDLAFQLLKGPLGSGYMTCPTCDYSAPYPSDEWVFTEDGYRCTECAENQ